MFAATGPPLARANALLKSSPPRGLPLLFHKLRVRAAGEQDPQCLHNQRRNHLCHVDKRLTVLEIGRELPCSSGAVDQSNNGGNIAEASPVSTVPASDTIIARCPTALSGAASYSQRCLVAVAGRFKRSSASSNASYQLEPVRPVSLRFELAKWPALSARL